MPEYIACICEGSAEKAIMDLLIDNNKLIFDRSDLLENEVISTRGAVKFQSRYLTQDYKGYKIRIIRILDSTKENFGKIGKPYSFLISNIENFYTRPEIEILIIIALKRYDDYKRNHSELKPSAYCKTILYLREVKTYDFVIKFFSDIDLLVSTLQTYAHYSRASGYKSIYNLLQKESSE